MNCASGKNEKRPSKKGKRPSKKRKGNGDETEDLEGEKRESVREPDEETKTSEVDRRISERRKDNRETHGHMEHASTTDKSTIDTTSPKNTVVDETIPKRSHIDQNELVESKIGPECDPITFICTTDRDTDEQKMFSPVITFGEIGESTDFIDGEEPALETIEDQTIDKSTCVVDCVEVHEKLDFVKEVEKDEGLEVIETSNEDNNNDNQYREVIVKDSKKLDESSNAVTIKDTKRRVSEGESDDEDGAIYIKMRQHVDILNTDNLHSINNHAEIYNHQTDTVNATVKDGLNSENTDKSTNETCEQKWQSKDKRLSDIAETKADFEDAKCESESENEDEKKEHEVIHEIETNEELPFSRHVDRSAIARVLIEHAEHINEGHDVEVGEEIIVQYLIKMDRKRLKKVLRPAAWSLNHKIRKVLWYKMCHYLYRADDSDIYAEYVRELFPKEDQPDIRIPAFVDPKHVYSFHLNKGGIRTAHKILCVVEHMCPDIINSPLLYSITCLFLHFMGASQCYSCVYAMLRDRDSKYLPTTKVSFEASKLVIRDLAKKYAKSGYSYMVRNVGNIDQVFDSWLWWVFEDLPITYLVHIVDCYLHEGIKVIYRVVLSIIIHFYKHSGKRSGQRLEGSTVVHSLREFCRDMPVRIDKLLKAGFSLRGFSRKEIKRLQIKHEMYITSTKNISALQDALQEKPLGSLPMSRSFSGPMVLQSFPSNMVTSDMHSKELKRTYSAGAMSPLPSFPQVNYSSLLDRASLYAVWTWLPNRFSVCQPELLYTTEEHGTSLVTLYQRVENHQPTVIVIKTTNDEIFGAFCSADWSDRRQKSSLLSYFGTGETFIFTLYPIKQKYEWVGLKDENIPNTANMFQAGDNSILTIGGGHGEAIFLDENLLHCRSEKCDTFNNEPLSQSEDFKCKVVEVYGLS
ncbi:GTPase-activating protein skywalker-like isoform X2 [Dreissena polymorpha]|uniref:GTPase-activating protein skywalker-like isoform X2 n=1 Tax=Dreissena polymorpha TaxID=45954 RepID=UPI00226518B7|nr:GTPase-activating protein skywalker-like isoform X2 [Dreissena polymorpha]